MRTTYFGSRPYGTQSEARLKILLIASMTVGLCTSISIIYLTWGSRERNIPTTPQLVESPAMRAILIPRQEIPPGTLLSAAMFKIENRPAAQLVDAALTTYEEITGYYSKTILLSDQPITSSYVTAKPPTSAITANIPEGYRAVTIRVNDTKSMVGWAQPGSAIDVTWITKSRGAPCIAVLVQNALILSVDREVVPNTHPDRPIPTTFTLRVSEEDAANILLAESSGELGVTLRGDGNGKASKPIHNCVADLPGGPIPKKPDDKNDGTLTIEGKKFRIVNGKLQGF